MVRKVLPVGDDTDDVQEAVDEFKGEGGRRKTFDRSVVEGRARAILKRVEAERARGFEHLAEDGQIFESVDAVMAYELAGRKVTTRSSPKSEPEKK